MNRCGRGISETPNPREPMVFTLSSIGILVSASRQLRYTRPLPNVFPSQLYFGAASVDSGVIGRAIEFDIVFVIAVCIGIKVLLPGARESMLAMLALRSKMVAASSTEGILFLRRLRTASRNRCILHSQHLNARY